MGDGDAERPRASESFPGAGDLEALEKLVAGIEKYLGDALALLPEQDRALLIDYYGLEGVTSSATSRPPELHTEEARRIALRQARLRFNEALESVLAGAVQHERGDRQTLQEALAFVRGAVA